MMVPTNLAVTGPRKSGKSRLIRSLLAAIERPSALVESVPLVQGGQVRGYAIRGPDGVLHPFAHENWTLHPPFMRFGFAPEVFDNLAPMIDEVRRRFPVVAIDELGVMEDQAIAFRHAVLRLLDSQVITLLALKEEFVGEFTAEVRARDDVKIWRLGDTSWEEVRSQMAAYLALLHLPGG